MTVDDTLEVLFSTFKDSEFKKFSDISEKLKIVHRCLDGFGMDYNQERITSIKAYSKILDHYPKFSDDFSRGFLGNTDFKQAFHNLCEQKSPCLLDRSSGLSGINIALKKDLSSGTMTKSAYIKTIPHSCTVINYRNDILYKTKYIYIKNSLFKYFINKMFDLRAPSTNHALELSRKNSIKAATIYPIFDFSQNKPSKMSEYFLDFFSNLQMHDPWPIEDKILAAIAQNFPYLTPITKGYKSGGEDRKIYFGACSYKHSAFKFFK